MLGEALSNAGRHADASAIDVVVTADDEVVVVVADDGKGIGEGVVESGLGNIRERALKHGGTLSVRSAPGAGTTLIWAVPVSRGPAD